MNKITRKGMNMNTKKVMKKTTKYSRFQENEKDYKVTNQDYKERNTQD